MRCFPTWTYGVWFAAWVWLMAPAGAQAQEGVTLEEAMALAMAQNPALGAADRQARALEEVPPGMGTLPDPMLRLGLMNLPVDSFALDQEPMTQVQVGVQQRFPFPGKLGLREAAAMGDARAARAEVEELRLTLTAQVSAEWWHLFHLDRALEIVARNQELLRQFVTVARTKYKVGKGLQQDVLLAEVELSRLLDRELQLEADRARTRARLNALMGRPAGSAVPMPPQADDTLPDVPPVDALLAMATGRRPMIGAARERLAAAQARRDLARKDHLPDLNLDAAYGLRSGTNPDGSARADFASVMVGINLPLHLAARQRRLVAQRDREREARAANLSSLEQAVEAEITGLAAGYGREREQVQLLRQGIIPQASQSVASMVAGYQVNKVDFLNLVRAQITLYDHQIRYWQALADAKTTLARLASAVGGARFGAAEEAPPPAPEVPAGEGEPR